MLPPKGQQWVSEIFVTRPRISFITEIELLAWYPENPDSRTVYHRFVEMATIEGINKEFILKTIEIRQKYKLKIPDAIIAATAIILDIILFADNDKDFLKVSVLKYNNPAIKTKE